jgi:hypothetical protein
VHIPPIFKVFSLQIVQFVRDEQSKHKESQNEHDEAAESQNNPRLQ